ncbi:MBOAT family O-acyltransferase [Tenuifilum sp.]|uniref:MBOAT family O-acyltransferase n=1 Tax=Tenuifilum sp. TaxID=2760880 RepID=UPI0025848BDB|nr:MBOAT family O-acyltransferase [Tenuifilum sp.]
MNILTPMDQLTNLILDFLKYHDGDSLIFTQASFWVFFGVLLLGYTLVYNRPIARSAYLLVFSLFFYFKSSGLFFSLLLFSTVVDYSIGYLISISNSETKKRWLVALSVFVNLSVLSYFKYSYFLVNLINSIFETNFVTVNYLALWSNSLFHTSFDTLNILLPVGISFYTFQTISYTVDVYRGRVKPVKNIIDFAFYVSFFPQLVAGPIVRASEFIPQIFRKYNLSAKEFGHALFLILGGLFKKMVISDYLSVNFVDRVFDNPLSFTGFESLLATYGYALQIYCDFSGYTDIAIGLALLLGFRLPINFNEPYKANSLTDFWHRWHISLSSWLRDYLYIPLGGNRKGKLRTYINLMITMLLGGLWHGAHWRFVVWGGIHGVGLAIEKMISNFRKVKVVWNKPLKRFLGIFLTFHLVCFSWIFFRANSFATALQLIKKIFTDFGINYVPSIVLGNLDVLAMLTLGFLLHWLPFNLKENIRGNFIKSPWYVKLLVAFAIIVIIVQFQYLGIKPFIYFRF